MTMHVPPEAALPAPVNIEAEQAVLGAILLRNDALSHVSDFLEADHFSEPVHQVIYRVARGLIAEGHVADPRTLAHHLGSVDLGDGMTPQRYTAALAREAVTTTNAGEYGRIVYELWQRREMMRLCQQAIADLSDFDVGRKPADAATDLAARLDAVAASARAKNLRRVSIGEAAREALVLAQAAREGRGEHGIRTGISRLDDLTNGMGQGEFWVLAGRPGMGKTALAISIALKAAQSYRQRPDGTKERCGVLFVSLETGGVRLAQRALTSIAYRDGRPIYYSDVVSGRGLSGDDMERLEAAASVLAKVPLEIEQEGSLTAQQIAERARRAAQHFARQGVALGLVIVDHIQLVATTIRRDANRTEQVTEVTGRLMALSKELGCCVLGLSQLSRAIEGREDKRPKLADLRESGSIEQDADVVLGLYRPAYYLAKESHNDAAKAMELHRCKNDLEIDILKQRQGETDRVLAFADIGQNFVGDRQFDERAGGGF